MHTRFERVNQILLDELGTAFPFAAEVLHAETRAGLGPLSAAVLVAFGDRGHEEELLAAASAIELVSASAGPVRELVDRPRDSSARVNNALCVLITDFALSRGARQAVRAGELLIQELSLVMKLIYQAQFTETQRLFDPSRMAEDYILTAQGRMGPPLALAARFAASWLGSEPDAVMRLAAFGRKLGLAAQIYEDAHELMHGIPAKGQHPGTNLRLGAYGLPILYAVEYDEALGELLRGTVDRDDLPEIVKRAFATGAMTRTSQLVTDIIDDAMSLLEGLDGLFFERLGALATLVLEQTHILIGDSRPASDIRAALPLISDY
jgi:Polyprenyl synthetase